MPGRNRATLSCRGSWMRGDAAASPAHAATASATRCPPSEYGVDAQRDVAPAQHLCKRLLLHRITWLGGPTATACTVRYVRASGDPPPRGDPDRRRAPRRLRPGWRPAPCARSRCIRLVGHLVVVGMQSGGEERDRDAVARVLVVVRAAVDVRRMPVGVDRVVEHEAVAARSIDLLHQIAQLGREAT